MNVPPPQAHRLVVAILGFAFGLGVLIVLVAGTYPAETWSVRLAAVGLGLQLFGLITALPAIAVELTYPLVLENLGNNFEEYVTHRWWPGFRLPYGWVRLSLLLLGTLMLLGGLALQLCSTLMPSSR